MTEQTDPTDEVLDIHQKMIDMIRAFGGSEYDRKCDSLERRLYEWHDRFLEIQTDALITGRENFTPEEQEELLGISALQLEIVTIGNGIFDKKSPE